ncbi:MAG: hypothetical protein PVG51_13540 [Desulfosarcina sp.]
MSLRLIARDLYRLHRQVDRLRRQLTDAPVDRRATLSDKLKRAVAERDQVRKILDGRLDR